MLRSSRNPALSIFWPTLIFGAILGVSWSIAAWTASWRSILAGTVLGLGFWTLLEYVMHRFILHPPLGERRGFTRHEQHHLQPRQGEYLAVPLAGSLGIFAVLLGGVWLLTWSVSRAAGFVCGLVLGYLIYEWIHFAAHYHKTDISWLQRQYRRHLKHHYEDAGRNFGVTSPLWDWILRT